VTSWRLLVTPLAAPSIIEQVHHWGPTTVKHKPEEKKGVNIEKYVEINTHGKIRTFFQPFTLRAQVERSNRWAIRPLIFLH
jgi:hypothetical protein